MTPVDTSTPLNAREHARAMAGTVVEAMPTIPASRSQDLPAGVRAEDMLWEETLAPGGYTARILKRGARLRLVDTRGDACANVLVYNAERPIERLNVADTQKVQWNAYLKPGALILSDMGRVLMSILEDTCGQHDLFCGCSNERTNAAKYGQGANHTASPNGRDRFLLALAKFGLGRKDVMPNLNLFKGVTVENGGALTFNPKSSFAGAQVTLRAEMNVLVVIANTPHVLDPRDAYSVTPLRLTAWRGPVAPIDDPIRNGTPEGLRAFENVEDYYNL